MVSMMSNNDICFVVGQMGHFGWHCPDVQCYGCDEFGHFALDLPIKIPPSETPWHHDRSHSKLQYTRRDRSYSTFHDVRHGRHFSQSQSHCHSHCDRNSSFRGHTSHSSSTHHSSSCCPLANGCPHHHSCHDTSNQHSCTQSCTHHFSYRYHSCHYSTEQSQSHSSNSHCTAQETQPRKAKPHPRPSTPNKPHCSKTVIIKNSPSDSSSDSYSDSDPLNY